jgi:sporulation protein YlmC with PRC-barrel domain
MKTTIITYTIKIVIAILEYVLKKYGKKEGQEVEYVQDIQINEDASKMFSEFIKKHTKKISEESKKEESENSDSAEQSETKDEALNA